MVFRDSSSRQVDLREVPRFPAALGCDLVEPKQGGRLFGRRKPGVTPAAIDELSVNGARILILHTNRTDRFRVGARLRFSVGEADGVLQVRHLYANQNGMGLGVQFEKLSPELSRVGHDAIDAQPDGESADQPATA